MTEIEANLTYIVYLRPAELQKIIKTKIKTSKNNQMQK